MPTRFTRNTRDNPFDLDPNERSGAFPPEGPNEESVTLRVIKTPTGAEMLIRFSQRGLDAYGVHPIEALPGKTLSDTELMEEAADIARSMIKGLLNPPTGDRYVEIEPGIWIAKERRRPRDAVDSVEAEMFEAMRKLQSLKLPLTRKYAISRGGLSLATAHSLDRKLRNAKARSWTKLRNEFLAKSTTKIRE